MHKARTKMSKELVERFFLCPVYRSIFDRYIDEMMNDDTIYKPCKSRSHIKPKE